MRRAFASNLIILLAVNALIKPLYVFGVDLGVQNVVGTVAYGRYAYWFSYAFMFVVLYDMGLQNYNAVELARRPDLLKARLPLALSLKLLLSGLFLSAVLISALWAIGPAPEDLWLLSLLAIMLITQSVWQLLRNNLGAQGKYRINSILSAADKAFLLLVVGALLLSEEGRSWITVERFVILQILGLSLAAGLTVFYTELEKGQPGLDWDWVGIKSLLGKTFPYALILLLSTAATRIDALMINALLEEGLYQNGMYAAAYRLLDAINMVAFLLVTLLLPMLSKLVEANSPVSALLRQGAHYALGLSIGVAAFTQFYGQDIVQFLYREATDAWGPVLSALMWAAMGTSLVYVLGAYLLARHKAGWTNWFFAGAMLFNILSNAYLIPRYGAVGAAVATALTQAGIALAEWIACAVLTKNEEDRFGRAVSWLRPFAFAVLVLATAWLWHWLEISWVRALPLHGISCVVAALLSGLMGEPRKILAGLQIRSSSKT